MNTIGFWLSVAIAVSLALWGVAVQFGARLLAFIQNGVALDPPAALALVFIGGGIALLTAGFALNTYAWRLVDRRDVRRERDMSWLLICMGGATLAAGIGSALTLEVAGW